MKTTKTKWLNISIAVLVMIGFAAEIHFHKPENQLRHPKKVSSTSSRRASVQAKKARAEYFFKMLRDPVTNTIPQDIRKKELIFAGQFRTMAKSSAAPYFFWKEAGPLDVGGRTRALGIDINNSNIIIAGGVSGGVWKSTDHGNIWTLKNDPTQNLSITSLVQDPRPGHTQTWYYASGEYIGDSAAAHGGDAFFNGSGLYKSTDNGETWVQIQSAGKTSIWETQYDYISRITVNPLTGTVFLAAHGFGIFRSTNGGSSFTLTLGNTADHIFSDIVVASDGTVVASISQAGWNDGYENDPGLYKSSNDGQTWQNITPGNYPSTHERTVLAAAPSNANIVYAYINTGEMLNDDREDIRFLKINITTRISEDRTANLPDLGNDYSDYIDTQNNYNMVMAVKPDNENFVMIGASSLFRSSDGFSTTNNSTYFNWIGGYFLEPDWRYANLHPDQHAIAFDPSNPNQVWVGHDGGLSYCSNIQQNSTRNLLLNWEDKNNGYITTQFYTVALSRNSGDKNMLGGTQDNGTLHFTWNGTLPGNSADLSYGDGSYCYIGSNYAYTSSQNGEVLRLGILSNGSPGWAAGWTYVQPAEAENQLFIHPFVIDPADEDIMIYPDGGSLWRQTSLSTIPQFQQEPVSTGWTQLTNLDLPPGYSVTALAMTYQNPSHALYYGGSSDDGIPRIRRLYNANSADNGAVDINLPSPTPGSYVHDIAVNPENGQEILVVLSNYDIVGLYHSNNGGASYTAVEGNLTGTSNNPGPSLRSASILPLSSGPVYLLATSIGLFTTRRLNGNNTVWTQESADQMGNVVVAMVRSRSSDNRVVAGTHGRGLWVGELNPSDVNNPSIRPESLTLRQNYPNPFNPSTTIEYTVPVKQHVTLKLYDTRGREVAVLFDGIRNQGQYKTEWNGSALPSGIYIYKLKSGTEVISKKLTLLK